MDFVYLFIEIASSLDTISSAIKNFSGPHLKLHIFSAYSTEFFCEISQNYKEVCQTSEYYLKTISSGSFECHVSDTVVGMLKTNDRY